MRLGCSTAATVAALDPCSTGHGASSAFRKFLSKDALSYGDKPLIRRPIFCLLPMTFYRNVHAEHFDANTPLVLLETGGEGRLRRAEGIIALQE